MSMRATADAFVPRGRCPFYDLGTCRFGDGCQNLHIASSTAGRNGDGITVMEEEELASEIEKLTLSKDDRTKVEDDGTICVRTIDGAVVTFGAGTQVIDLKLPPTFEYGKWVQRNAVTCSWYRPAATAFLTYNDFAALTDAAEILLQTPNPSGRVLKCESLPSTPNDRPNRFKLQVRNLDPGCQEDWFKDVLGSKFPLKVKIRGLEYNTLPMEAKVTVEGLLKSIGDIEHIQFHSDQARNTLALSASFLDAKNVAKAVAELSTVHADIGMLFVKPWITIKYNIPTRIVTALRPELEQLEHNSRMEHRVRLKLPFPIDTDKSNQSLRISACSSDAGRLVSTVRVELEQLLAVTVIMDADFPLWHPLFATTPALPYLTTISHSHRLYIHRDPRKSQLVFYGGADTTQENARGVLINKVLDLNQPRQIWILSTEELETALKGGFSRLREVYADRVMLDIAQTPKKIIIQVHKKHLKTAKSVFRGEEFFYLHTLCAMPVCKCCATDKSHESSAPILNVLVPGYITLIVAQNQPLLR